MTKWIALATSAVCSLAFVGLLRPAAVRGMQGPPAHKKKEEHHGPPRPGGPGGDLRKSYDLLRRLRAEKSDSGRSSEQSRDWTERAVGFYRKAVRAFEGGDHRRAHEYGAAAHDLARAVEHSRNAASIEKRGSADSDLPPPPSEDGAEDESRHVRHDLWRAHERLVETEEDVKEAPEGRFYFDAARDLYNQARKEAEESRWDRAGELARAAEAMTHVPEHLAHLADDGRPDDGPPPRKEARRGRPGPPPPADDDGPPPKKEGRRGRFAPPPPPGANDGPARKKEGRRGRYAPPPPSDDDGPPAKKDRRRDHELPPPF